MTEQTPRRPLGQPIGWTPGPPTRRRCALGSAVAQSEPSPPPPIGAALDPVLGSVLGLEPGPAPASEGPPLS